jgi:peptidoglycan/LPS O-acetylase OafA/YrhL
MRRSELNSGERSRPPIGLYRRLPGLDVLRGIAILLVLLAHMQLGPPGMERDRAGALAPIVVPLRDFGWTGVDLFFVLSGFLVGGLLFQELRENPTLDLGRFIIRRGLKIWPGYYAFVIILFLNELRHGHSIGKTFMRFTPNLLHIQNYFRFAPGYPDNLGHSWSLAIEEHFYLLFPLALFLLTRCRQTNSKDIPSLPLILGGAILLCIVLRCCKIFLWHGDLNECYYWTQSRSDGLLFGVLLAYLHQFKPSWLVSLIGSRMRLILLGLTLISPVWVFVSAKEFIYSIGFTLLYFGFGCILLAVARTEPGRGRLGRLVQSLPAKLLAWMGVYSYSIYLWHRCFNHKFLAGGRFGSIRGPMEWLLDTLIYLSLSVIAGYLMARLIEMPALAVRDRFFPSKGKIV